MTHHERFPGQGRISARVTLGILIAILLLILIGIQYGCTPTEAKPPQEIVVDETLCNAKYANWIIRPSELAKPQPEQWHNFKRHMGACVR